MPDSFQIPSDTPAAYTGLDRLYIGGKWRAGASKPKANLNPYTGETLLEIPQASVADLDDAYAAAKAAQVAWAAKLPSERSKVLAKAAQILQSRREEVIGWLIKESGSTRLKASLEWQSVCGVFLEGSSLPYLVEGRILPADTLGKESRVYRKPVGVVGVISPWNWPLQLSARSVAPALAVGNAVVLKPASDTPITGGLIFAKIFEEAGLPPGVLNVVVGSGSEIGDAFVKHPTPRVISFTGSTKVGRGVARLAIEGPMLKKVDLELGGNSPLIVLDDADLDLAVEAAVFGKFLHNGQICMITNRLIVDAAVYDDFVDAYAAKVKALKVGDPNLSDTFIGPIINQAQFDGVADKIKQARAGGYREVAGGEPSGLVMPPHVFADVSNDSELAQDEIFGPIAPIIRAGSEAEALAMANNTEYGLSSAVFTRNVDRGVRFAQQVEAGMTHVNDQPVNDLPFNPFGGEKNSGLGRFNGRWVVDAFTTDHWITIQHEPRPYPFDASVLEPGTSSTGG